MKKFLIIFNLCSLICLSAYAQNGLDISAGNISLGGVVHFEFEHNGSNPLILIQVAPSFGYFITDNIMLTSGLYLLFQTGTGMYENTYNPFSFGIGGRYLFSTQELINLYIGLNAGIGFYFAEGFDISSQTLIFALPIGILISIHSKLALDIGLSPAYKISFEPDMSFINIPLALGFVAFF
jgi:hypothetical protein